MSETAIQLLLAVKTLPDEEQRELADAVLNQLREPDDELFAELERRRLLHEAGLDPGRPAPEVYARLAGRAGR